MFGLFLNGRTLYVPGTWDQLQVSVGVYRASHPKLMVRRITAAELAAYRQGEAAWAEAERAAERACSTG
jgi:hypothetical protein